LNKPSRCHIQK